MKGAAALILAIVLLTIGARTASMASRYDPRLRFRTISTARFDIHYHQGEERLAQRLARIAEEVASTLDTTLGPAHGRVQVILVDQNDLPNGWATPVPYNTIEITAAAPAADSIVGNSHDWLRLVFTHEYTHVVHLSRAGGWSAGLRRVFGRLPILYPNLFQPVWQIEGIATWQESERTGHGRLPAGDFRLLLEHAARAKRLEPLDRASSVRVDWPSGNTPYLYGAYFHQYLAERYGADSVRRLTDETARRLPYLGSRAFRAVFGQSLGELWTDFEASVRVEDLPASAAERLTRHGFYVSGPRFADEIRVLYSLADPHGFPALMELDLAASRSRTVTPRYLGEQVGSVGEDVVFDQIEVVRNVGRQSDLYMVSLRGGGTRRLTSGARAADPDVSPDRSRLAFTIQRADRRELAVAPFRPAFQLAPQVLVSSPGVDFASPRWSPDGSRIVAERRLRGGPSEIVVVDPATADVRVLVPTGRNATPVWSPDGAVVLFAAASDDAPFQIFSISAGGGEMRKLQGAGASAQSPAISPDGRTLVFVGYTADGYDLFRLPLTAAAWVPVSGSPPDTAPAIGPPLEELASEPYSPLRTVLPQFWTPTLESDHGEMVVGAATGSFDVLARHGYGAEAGWSTSRRRPDWQVAYAYDRWRPTFFATASDDTDPWRQGTLRIIEGSAGMLLTTRRVRWSHSALAELHHSSEAFACGGAAAGCASANEARGRRTSVRTGLAYDSARMFGYSISPEEGGRVRTTLEFTRSPSFAGAASVAATLDARGYLRVWPRHAAVALRGAAAGSWGDTPLRRVFSASGSDARGGGFRFGSDAIGMIRGVESDRVLGHRSAVVNVDYRVPLVHLERGVGTVPVFVRAVHAALFLDAGHAWSQRFRRQDVRYSAGAELSMDTIVGYFAPLTLSAGGAWRGGPDPDERGFVAFARIGRAF